MTRFATCAALLFAVSLLTASFPLMGGHADLRIIVLTTVPLLVAVAVSFKFKASLYVVPAIAMLAVADWVWGIVWVLRADVWRPRGPISALFDLAPGLLFSALFIGAALCAVLTLRALLAQRDKTIRTFD